MQYKRQSKSALSNPNDTIEIFFFITNQNKDKVKAVMAFSYTSARILLLIWQRTSYFVKNGTAIMVADDTWRASSRARDQVESLWAKKNMSKISFSLQSVIFYGIWKPYALETLFFL